MGNLRASSLEVTDEAGGRLSLPEEKAWSEKRSRWERSVGSSGRQRKAALGRTEGDWAEIRRKPGALSRAEAVLRVEVSDAAGRPAQMRTKICPRVTEAEAGQAPLSGRNGRPAQV